MDTILTETVDKLVALGFYVNKVDSDGSAMMLRKQGPSTRYAEVECFDGKTVTVNGVSFEAYAKSL